MDVFHAFQALWGFHDREWVTVLLLWDVALTGGFVAILARMARRER